MQNKSSKETFESFYQWVIIFSKIRLLQGKVLSQYRRNSIGLKSQEINSGVKNQLGARWEEKEDRKIFNSDSGYVRSHLCYLSSHYIFEPLIPKL